MSMGVALAQTFSIDWHTIDSGGATFTNGGGFELGGTIGQADAGSYTVPMAGGAFELVGGFWFADAAPTGCACPGDMNSDGLKDGRDITQFTSCVIIGGTCSCADVDGVPGVNTADVSAFVTLLLTGTPCG